MPLNGQAIVCRKIRAGSFQGMFFGAAVRCVFHNAWLAVYGYKCSQG